MKKLYKQHKPLPKYTFLGCPMTKNRSPWCFRMCTPDTESTGLCGRLAPHAVKSKIQIGIDNYKTATHTCK